MLRPQDIVIVSAVRTPIGRFQGTLKDTPAPQLGAMAIREVLRRAGLASQHVDEVLLGHVLQAGVGQNPARQASLAAGLPPSVGATTINKVCGSGLKAVTLGAAMLRAGDAQVIVAGGMESMDNAPYLLTQARSGYRLGDGKLVDVAVHDGLWCAIEQQHMGLAAEWTAETYRVGREDMDAYALRSHQRAIAAQDRGAFQSELAPVSIPQPKGEPHILAHDECPRRDTSLGSLARLAPVFRADGRVTAGNASGLADGAAAVVLMSASKAQDLGCTVLARIVGYAQAAGPALEIFAAPVLATRHVLQHTGLSLSDIDLVEINEAFAAQILADARTLGLEEDRLNVNGGAIALGHPLGASGARILVTLLYALRERALHRGLAVICLGGGEAVAVVVELVY